ncbi:MAG: ankyrin repeat domain-containing protein [Saprospiraceae bacterium]|nr:ankyrin repeat domain-containing protein [Saprospiraceae bacterium]
MLSILSYLIIAGMLIFLVFMSGESRGGGDAATRGLGKYLILLPIVAIVCLVVFNLPTSHWIKYFGLVIGFLCVVALVVFLLALSGSSLIFQDTRTPREPPQYEDPILTQLFDAFHKGKVKQWKTLLQSHPEHVQHKKLLQDILYDANADDESNTRKLEAVKYMLDAGAKIDTSNCSNLAFFASSGKTDFIELLLQHGADPNCIPWPGETVLCFSIGSYYEEGTVIDLLVKYGADVHAKKYDQQHQDSIPPLLYAAYYGRWHCCQTLLKNGADPHFKNKDGVSIKDFILKESEKSKDHLYYQEPEFLKLVEQIKHYQ